MKTKLFRLVLICAVLLGYAFPGSVQASKGTPSSADFGYGVQVDLEGKQVLASLPAAVALHVDWIGLDFDWSRHWPDSHTQPDLQLLDQVMQFAQEANISVLLSLTHAPAWASTPQGPDPTMTAWFTTNLIKRYPAIQAVELFPSANTQKGWGAAPDPTLYVNLLKVTRAAFQEANLNIILVAGGLTPLCSRPGNGDQEDLTFLKGLYQVGGSEQIPVISERLPELTGDPLQAPDFSSTTEANTQCILRRYEKIRQVMLENNHSAGVLWVTHFSGPSGKIQASDSTIPGSQEQTLWLTQAYRLLRAQLYIGVAFYHQLNPSANSEGDAPSLIRSDLSRDPFYDILGKLVAQNNQEFNSSPDFGEPQVKHIIKNRG